MVKKFKITAMERRAIDADSHVRILRTGICPFTEKAYDCVTCKGDKSPPLEPGSLHFSLCVNSEYTAQEIQLYCSGIRFGIFTPRAVHIRAYFQTLEELGADVLPLGKCDRFCYVRGCAGHPNESKSTDASDEKEVDDDRF